MLQTIKTSEILNVYASICLHFHLDLHFQNLKVTYFEETVTAFSVII